MDSTTTLPTSPAASPTPSVPAQVPAQAPVAPPPMVELEPVVVAAHAVGPLGPHTLEAHGLSEPTPDIPPATTPVASDASLMASTAGATTSLTPTAADTPWWTNSDMVLPGVAALAGVALIAWALVQRARQRAGRTQAPSARATTAIDAQDQRELTDLTDQLVAQLDQRSEALERLVAQADDRIVQLRTELSKADLARARLASQRTVALADAVLETKPAASPVSVPAVPVVPVPTARVTTMPSAASDLGGHPHRAIYVLADRGLSPVEIARQTGKPTGQIELILNLRRAASAA